MKMIDINNSARIYMGGDRITCDRSGCGPMSEAYMHELLAKALSLRDSLDLAITDMRALISGDYGKPTVKTGKIGKTQRQVLESLKRHGAWYPNCGWLWTTHSETAKILDSLVVRGMVVKLGHRYELAEDYADQ